MPSQASGAQTGVILKSRREITHDRFGNDASADRRHRKFSRTHAQPVCVLDAGDNALRARRRQAEPLSTASEVIDAATTAQEISKCLAADPVRISKAGLARELLSPACTNLVQRFFMSLEATSRA